MSIGEGTGIRTVNRLIPDAVAWAIAALLVVLLRYDFLVPLTVWPFALIVIAGLIAAQFAAGFVLHLYRGRYLYGSIEEVRALGLAALLVGVLMGVVLLVWMRQPAGGPSNRPLRDGDRVGPDAGLPLRAARLQPEER